MLPCGTVTVTGLALNVALLIEVTTVRDDKYDVNQLMTDFEKPRFLNFKTSSS
jgi:hypothetical protein